MADPSAAFTPAEIDTARCMARTWAQGKGGQFGKVKLEGSDFCTTHGQADKYKVHGRVDGAIPAKKLEEFVKASTTVPKPELSPEEAAEKKRKREEAKEGKGDKEERKKKKKKHLAAKNDPNRPKKPAGGAYGCFVAKHRQTFMKECVGKPVTAVSKVASERWKLVSQEDKKPYETAYAAKKAAYDKAMETYVPPSESEEEEKEDENAEKAEEKDEEDEGSEPKAMKSQKKEKETKKPAIVAMKASKTKPGKFVMKIVKKLAKAPKQIAKRPAAKRG